LTFAHRGGAKLYPENTMAAFRGALEHGCDFVETDCRMTRDGKIVLHHDADVRRTTDGRGPVASMSLAELQALDAGVRFGPGFGGQCVPTLEDLATLDPALRINVELKQGRPCMVMAVLHEIERLELWDRIVVAAQQHDVMTAFRKVARGRVATSASGKEIRQFWLAAKLGLEGRLRVEFDALQVPVAHRGLNVVTRRFVQRAHRCGVQVHVWTIDDPRQMRAMIDVGVDGIMSDRPDLLTRTLGRA